MSVLKIVRHSFADNNLDLNRDNFGEVDWENN